MPIPLVTTMTATMMAAMVHNRSRLGTPDLGKRAESKTTWMSRGLMTPRPAENRINTPTRMTWGR